MRDHFEKLVVIILAVMLLAGSLILYRRNTRPFSDITIVQNGIRKELTLAQVENLLKEKNRIDINTASAKEMERIPGVGAVMASRIVEYREKNGSFTSNDQLLEIEGIGEKKFAVMKEYLK